MKKLLTTTAAICVAATQAGAGSLAEPIVEPPVAAPPSSSSAGSGGFGHCKQSGGQKVGGPQNCGQQANSGGNVLVPILVIGAIIGIAVAASSNNGKVSDRRLKRNITQVGTAANGLPIYRYQYLWFKQYYEGVMAQDVLLHTPKAIIKGLFGVMLVNYDVLGMEMKAVG